MSSEHSPDEYSVRLGKLASLQEQGIAPYPAESHRTRMAKQALDEYERLAADKEAVTVAGRLMALRGHGGSCFADLEDASGRIQILFKKDAVGQQSFATLQQLVDRADIVEVSGALFTTKMGEKTVEASGWRLLTKTLLPLPDKWHGLVDTELRYRKRHLDLLSNAETRAIFKTRSLVVRAIREFLDGEGFMEVETPILQPLAGGASARPFVTHHHALDIDLYLRVAPELYLKRLIVGGFEKVYEIARCFRNEGISFQHNPEFTQVEFYWAYATYEDLMRLTERLLQKLVGVATGGRTSVERDGVALEFSGTLPRLKFFDLIKEKAGIDLDEASNEALLKSAVANGGLEIDPGTVGYGELCDALYKKYVRPSLIQPCFVTDYPAEMIPLAKRKAEDPRKIATMQLVVQGMELVKAYNELNDPLDQEARFREEEMKKGKGSEEAQETDADFVEALKHGMPPTAGFGMGIDRLCAVLLGTHGIKETILFPTMKPEQEQ